MKNVFGLNDHFMIDRVSQRSAEGVNGGTFVLPDLSPIVTQPGHVANLVPNVALSVEKSHPENLQKDREVVRKG